MLLTCRVPLAAAAVPQAPKTTEFGHGPTVVLIHGLGGGRLAWMPTARRLLAGHHVVMVDLPGHGESALPDPFSLDAAAEAIDQVLARQSPDSTVVVGYGLGGMLGMVAASAHPGQVRGVIVIDGAVRSEQQIPDQEQRYFLEFLDENYDQVLKMMFTRMGRDSLEGLRLHAQAAQAPPVTMKKYMRELLNADFGKALKQLRTPLLFVGTEKVWPADKDWAAVARQRGYEQAGMGVASRRLGQCGALVMSDQPDSLAAVISEFAAHVLVRQ